MVSSALHANTDQEHKNPKKRQELIKQGSPQQGCQASSIRAFAVVHLGTRQLFFIKRVAAPVALSQQGFCFQRGQCSAVVIRVLSFGRFCMRSRRVVIACKILRGLTRD